MKVVVEKISRLVGLEVIDFSYHLTKDNECRLSWLMKKLLLILSVLCCVKQLRIKHFKLQLELYFISTLEYSMRFLITNLFHVFFYFHAFIGEIICLLQQIKILISLLSHETKTIENSDFIQLFSLMLFNFSSLRFQRPHVGFSISPAKLEIKNEFSYSIKN